MTRGRDSQLVKQTGEYLVAAELCRRSQVCTTFTGNMPDFDILTISKEKKHALIQVKARRKGKRVWIFDCYVEQYLNILKQEGIQIIEGKKKLESPDLIWIFVLLGKEYGDDEFYVLTMKNLQDVIYNSYEILLERRKGKRESTHLALKPYDLREYKDRWELITDS